MVNDILVITGLSGAGRSQAADNLEDLGWFVVDNMPTSLVEKVAELGSAPGSTIERLALVVGSGPHQADILEVMGRLRRAGHRVRVLFLDASNHEIVRRYSSTRRRHPLVDEHAMASVSDAIDFERQLLQGVKEEADVVIDTTDLNVHQLKARINDYFGGDSPKAAVQLTLLSFGYKHGLPLDADIVFDVRFLPNPYWIESMRSQSGLDDDVRHYVLDQDVAPEFLDRVDSLLDLLIPNYAKEGKSYLAVAVGCTGGQHRSVVIVEELARRLGKQHDVRVLHRDLGR
jgi:UPF0042 nucleotide-binding protein